MTKSLIIFDLDGTLIDSVPDLADGVDGMLAHFGKPPAGVSLVKDWVGNGSRTLVERALAWANLKTDTALAHEVFLKSYERHQGKTVEYAGVSVGLERLKAEGFMLALCTNKPAQFLPAILAKMGWTDLFSCVVGGDTLPTKKPDPAPLYHICTTLKVAPKDAIMVGDSKNDIQAGKQAGMMTLALTYGYNYGIPIAESLPDEVFYEFGQMVGFVLSLCK